MPTTEERIDRLENIVVELAEAQMRTQVSLKTLSEAQTQTDASLKLLADEMREFKDEMQEEVRAIKEGIRMSTARTDQRTEGSLAEEMKASRRQVNIQWSEGALRRGTFDREIVAPKIPKIAQGYFGWEEEDEFTLRCQVRNRKPGFKYRELGPIAVWNDQVIICENASTPRIDYINEFIEVLDEFDEYFPMYADKTIIPIFGSLYMSEEVVNYLTQHQIYALAMRDEDMDLLNFEQVVDKCSSK